ncbi:MAG: cation transporter, partial [Mycobacterium sp.]
MTVAAPAGSDKAQVRRLQLELTGMSCGACAARVQTALNKVDGVHASVNFATRIATIEAPGNVDAADLCEVVGKAGYQARERAKRSVDQHDEDLDHAHYLLRRLAVAAVLFVPVADLSVMFAVVPSTRFPGWEWVLTALAAPVVTWAAWPFHKVALRNARHRTASMETLISVGIAAASIWSLYTVFFSHRALETRGVWQALAGSDAIYFEVAAGVTVFVLAGRYFEARAKSKAGSALRALAALTAKDVCVLLADGSEMTIPADELAEQQTFVVRPGETIAADGLVVD